MSFSLIHAVVAHHELPVLRIAQAVGSKKKPKWEEPLLLQGEVLRRLFPAAAAEQRVYLFHFGSIVFVDFRQADVQVFLQSLQNHGVPASTELARRFQENYRIEWGAAKLEVANDAIHLMEAPSFHEEIVATVLAKSIAFEAIENQVEELLDEMETTIEQLKQGRLSTSDKTLSRLFGRILDYKLKSVSSLQLLDEPDITWEDEQAAWLFSKMYQLFELKTRYEVIRHKSDTLMSIAEVFSGMVHARRSTLLEWGIILLILVEIVLSLWQMH